MVDSEAKLLSSIRDALRKSANRENQRRKALRRSKNNQMEDFKVEERMQVRNVLLRNSTLQDVLSFIQNLCEGQNEILQNYLRQQNSTKSVNLVVEVAKLLLVIIGQQGQKNIGKNVNEFNDGIVVKCLHTLAEFCLGPCTGNSFPSLLGAYNSRKSRSIVGYNSFELENSRSDSRLDYLRFASNV